MAQALVGRNIDVGTGGEGAIAVLFPAGLPVLPGMHTQEENGKGSVPWDCAKQIPEEASVCSPEGQREASG